MTGRVLSLHRSANHSLSKETAPALRLVRGLGVEGDAHFGRTVQHRSRVAIDPAQPNLRQVHLLHVELLRELEAEGFAVGPGLLGENLLTQDIALLELPPGTRLKIGNQVELQVTGLRNPCQQLDAIDPRLLGRLAYREGSGELTRIAGIMSVVIASGQVHLNDPIQIELPPGPHHPLLPV